MADLGEDTDEISFVRRGANLGWPCYEANQRYEPYSGTTGCRKLYRRSPSALQAPSLVFGSEAARSIVGGTFYSGSKYPNRYVGSYFFADFIYGWMKVARFDRQGRAIGKPRTFGTGLSGPVAIHQGADGLLYYLSYVKGALQRARYENPTQAPRADP